MLYKIIENIKNNFIENIESYREDNNNNNNNYPSFIYILKKEIEIIKKKYNENKTLVIGLFVIFILVLITDLNTVSSISLRTVVNQYGGKTEAQIKEKAEKDAEKAEKDAKKKAEKEEEKIKKKAKKAGKTPEAYKAEKEAKKEKAAERQKAFDQKMQGKKQAYKQRESKRMPKEQRDAEIKKREQRDAERKKRLGDASASAFGGPGFFNKIKFHLLRGASAIGIILLVVGVVVVPIILYAIVLFMVLKSNVTTLTTKL